MGSSWPPGVLEEAEGRTEGARSWGGPSSSTPGTDGTPEAVRGQRRALTTLHGWGRGRAKRPPGMPAVGDACGNSTGRLGREQELLCREEVRRVRLRRHPGREQPPRPAGSACSPRSGTHTACGQSDQQSGSGQVLPAVATTHFRQGHRVSPTKDGGCRALLCGPLWMFAQQSSGVTCTGPGAAEAGGQLPLALEQPSPCSSAWRSLSSKPEPLPHLASP